ncbi:hypothetical protein CSUB01_07591 [Colletotrichum sublineola]|uniref:Uncharacterized protein n=1 Tax=Colletotrichum sublineola TaxID=1173701 RepID=A0A066XQJ2_COLSU|nr:hypothetical protein CSUB01_07591 [Colletotrichum sublineola]
MAAKKAVAKKSTTVGKTPARKSTAKKSTAKKSTTKKTTARKTTAKKATAVPRDTTAHDLSAALRNDEVPTDPRVLADFGFDRCFSGPDRAHLSMVYAALMIDLGVRPNELNKWLLAADGDGDGASVSSDNVSNSSSSTGGRRGLKRVGDRIRARFAARADRLRPGPHLAWFRDHQYVWDDADASGRARARAAARRMVKENIASLRKKVKKGERDEVFDWWS